MVLLFQVLNKQGARVANIPELFFISKYIIRLIAFKKANTIKLYIKLIDYNLLFIHRQL